MRTGNIYMEAQKFEQVCKYFHDNEVTKIRIMGGEPTIHPNFGVMTEIAQNYFERVTVFTNGTSNRILEFRPRKLDGINYNFTFHKTWNRDTFVQGNYNRTVSILLTKNTNIELVKEGIRKILTWNQHICISITLDCTSNIFKNRDILISKFCNLSTFCNELKLDTIMDHSLPICFIYGTKIPMRRKHFSCVDDCAGLIDASFNLRYCNQYSENPFPIFKDGKILPLNILKNHLSKEFYKRQVAILDKICLLCPLYKENCIGGCYIGNPRVTHNDIINNTDLPLM